MENKQNQRVFDDFPEVDCNACECYWTNQCNGTPTGSEKPCKTFKAIRRVSIPDELKCAQNSLERLWRVVVVWSICQFIVNMLLIYRPVIEPWLEGLGL